jgi:Trypsin
MKHPSFYLLLSSVLFLAQARAVEVGASYNTTAPTNSDIANWTTGWGTNGVTGWNYVGNLSVSGGPATGDSGVYLGNNWVLTAAHVANAGNIGAGTFTLGSTSYSVIAGSVQTIGTADMVLFQIDTTSTPAPNLPSLTIATSAPTAFSILQAGSSVAMIGYGGGQGETWGLNTVTSINQSVQINANSTTYTTTDFETAYGTTTHGLSSVTNSAQLVNGDSGGGDFIYNSSAGIWTLAGINEAVDLGTHDSYMVQLSTYATQINSVTSVPEPSAYALLSVGALLFGANALRRVHKKRVVDVK